MLKAFVLFGSLALCLFPESVQSAKSSFINYRCPMSGIGCFGNDVIHYYRIRNARSCALLCRYDRACVYWSYSKVNRGACYLKDACSNPRPDTKLISGYHKCIPRY